MKTRLRPTLALRLADDSDGQTIGNLCAACGYGVLDDADWSRVYPHWVVAEYDGLILGAVQVCPALPVGRIEFLAIEPELGLVDRAIILKGLADHACAVLVGFGCGLASFMIPDHLNSYRQVLENRGSAILFEGATLIKRLV